MRTPSARLPGLVRLVGPAARAILTAPGPDLVPIPRNDRGQPLDRHVARMLRLVGWLAHDPRPSTAPASQRRETRRNALLASPSARNVATRPATAGGRPARLYEPAGVDAPSPLLVYFHGGGFVVGDLETHHGVCRRLAAVAQCRVLAVDYRLAPEHPYPAAAHDALAAWREVVESPDRYGTAGGLVAVGGDSAGGNLAAGVAWRCRDTGLCAPAVQLLIYPGLDLTCSAPSHQTFADGFYLTSTMIGWFLGHYLEDPSRATEPLASPAFLDDLAGLCPAIVVTAGFDPLRDEGEAFAARLQAAGVPTELRKEERLIHGFVSMGGLVPAAADALDGLSRSLQRAFAESHPVEDSSEPPTPPGRSEDPASPAE